LSHGSRLKKKHPNEASTVDSKQSHFSAVPTGEDRLENAEEKKTKSNQNIVLSASQSPFEVQHHSGDDVLAISGSQLHDDRSEPVTPPSEGNPSPIHAHSAIRSLSSSTTSLPGKEDEPKILAHRISEMDESEALVVKPNPLFQGHLGA